VCKRIISSIDGAGFVALRSLPDVNPPSAQRRVMVALACALAAALAVSVAAGRSPPNEASDFTLYWRGGHALLDGLSPYKVVNDVGPYPYDSGFLYPIPAAIVAVPFALLSMHAGWIAWGAVSTGLLAFALTRDNFARLPLLMSLPMLSTVQQGQWAALVVVGGLLPALRVFGGLKPTLGAAVFAGLETRPQAITFAIAGAAVLLVATLIFPWWPADYVREIGMMEKTNYTPPITVLPFGPLIALVALRCRRADARLVLALACVPQAMLFYDQLPLVLLARTFRQSLVLALLSYLPLAIAPFMPGPPNESTPALMHVMSRILVPAYFLPCVAWVLWQAKRDKAAR
jgi:hypothetical protein